MTQRMSGEFRQREREAKGRRRERKIEEKRENGGRKVLEMKMNELPPQICYN